MPKSDVVSQGLMTVSEAIEFLGICRTKLYGLMDSGELEYCKIDRCRRIPRRAVIAFAQAHLVGGWRISEVRSTKHD